MVTATTIGPDVAKQLSKVYGADKTGQAGTAGPSDAKPADMMASPHGETAIARTATGWRVGDEDVSELTNAMVLADLIAAELPGDGAADMTVAGLPDSGGPADGAAADPRTLSRTVAQLERALTARVRVEQAIGVLAERHRLRPRQAFELLRSAARSRGRRVLEIATEVVDSASNPLLRIPEELAKPPVTRRRGRAPGQQLRNS